MKETFYSISAPVNMIIALIADFHNTDSDPIMRSLSDHHPDIITIAGDFLVGYRPTGDGLIVENQENVLPLFNACVKVAPTYVSLGNHEWMICQEDIERIEKTGAVVLDNSWVERGGIALGGQTSAIVSNFRAFREGIGERYPYRERRPHGRNIQPELSWLDEFEEVPGYKILLCHHPEYYPVYLRDRQVDLILSGHAHGGQVQLFGQGLYSPGQGWLPKFTSGVYDGKLVVSKGLANTSSPVPRIFNPTEIVYVKLENGGDQG